MGILETLLALAGLLLAGWLYVGTTGEPRPLPVTLSLAHPASAVLAASVTLGLVFTNEVRLSWAVGGLVGLAGAGLLRSRAAGPVGRSLPAAEEEPRKPLFASSKRNAAFVLLLLAVGVGTIVARLLFLPLDWDGWAIWQLKAKGMVGGGLREQFAAPEYGFSHPDYPLLVPTHTWWLCAGRFEPKIGQLGSFLFFLDLLILFHHEARRRLPPLAAGCGCVVLVSWAVLVKHAASGFADLPMTAYAFTAIVWLARGDLGIAAPALGGALLTKNEGLFTLAAVLLVAVLPVLRRGGEPSLRWRTLGVLLGTTALTLGAWSVMKRRWELPSDLLDASRWTPALLSSMPQRLAVIAERFVRQALSIGPK